MDKVYRVKLTDLIPLQNNPNKGSERGDYMLDESLERGGIGRSIVLADNGEILGGNHVYEKVGATFGDDQEVIVVETDGNQLVAVKRKDLPDSDDPRAKVLIFGDNRSGDFHNYDLEVIGSLIINDPDLAEMFFRPEEIVDIVSKDSGAKQKKIKVCPHCGMEL